MNNSSLSERDMDRLLSGKQLSDGAEAELAEFLGQARRVLRVPPSGKVEAAHLVKVVAAAQSASHASQATAPAVQEAKHVKSVQARGWALRLRMAAAKAGIAALGLTSATAGLATAGVNLPGDVAEKVFGAVGIDLPNQGAEDANRNPRGTSERVHAAQDEAREAGASGCEFGAAVSRAARGDDDESAPAHCQNQDKSGPGSQGRAKGHNKEPGVGRKDTPPGHDDNPGNQDNPGRGDDRGNQDNPGHDGENPGRGDENPGHGGENPGQGGDKDQDNSGPGNGNDDDNSGPGNGGDDDDDDNSGPGNGGDDDDDDNSGPGNGGDDDDDDNDNSGPGNGNDDDNSGRGHGGGDNSGLRRN